MRFLPSISASVALLLLACGAAAQQGRPAGRANELTLAGLRPGKDAFQAATKRYNAKYVSGDRDAS
jgi:hypothetical protein